MYLKQQTFRSEAWRKAVATLPCICCKREGMTQAAHPNHLGKGLAHKAPDCWCVPLCVYCHAEFDQGKRWTKLEKRELMDKWIILTLQDMATSGMLCVKT